MRLTTLLIVTAILAGSCLLMDLLKPWAPEMALRELPRGQRVGGETQEVTFVKTGKHIRGCGDVVGTR